MSMRPTEFKNTLRELATARRGLGRGPWCGVGRRPRAGTESAHTAQRLFKGPSTAAMPQALFEGPAYFQGGFFYNDTLDGCFNCESKRRVDPGMCTGKRLCQE